MTRRIFSLILIGLGAAGVLRALGFLGGHGILRAFAAQGNSGNTPGSGGNGGAAFDPRAAGAAIESAAVTARGGDPSAVSALTDAVFAYPHSYRRLPPSLEYPIKQRIANAEVAYRQGQSSGVQTADLVNAFNGLADKFGLPDYAKTSVVQIRYLRTSMALGFPQFMGEGLSRPGAKVGDPISDAMSPTQAAHLAQVLADQKLWNPDYQVPPDKWDPRILVRPRPAAGHAVSFRIDTKGPAIQNAVEAAASGMTLADAQQTLNDALGGLGI